MMHFKSLNFSTLFHFVPSHILLFMIVLYNQIRSTYIKVIEHLNDAKQAPQSEKIETLHAEIGI